MKALHMTKFPLPKRTPTPATNGGNGKQHCKNSKGRQKRRRRA